MLSFFFTSNIGKIMFSVNRQWFYCEDRLRTFASNVFNFNLLKSLQFTTAIDQGIPASNKCSSEWVE